MSNGDIMKCSEAVQCLKSDAVINGFAVGGGDGSSGCSESFKTYKRRKQVKAYEGSKVPEDERASVEVANQLADRIVKDSWEENNSCEQACPPRTDCQATVNGLDDCSERNCRNVILEHMYRTLSEDEGGVQGCIREALVFHREVGCMMSYKDCVHSDGYKDKCPLQIRNGSWNEDKGHALIMSNGSRNKSNHHTITERCQRAFCDILISEKFASLCKLLHENFQGSKIDTFFDKSLINTRMKDGAYERSPLLFCTDIQQVWKKLQGIGTEMMFLSKCLSDMSVTSYREQFCATNADSQTEREQIEVCGVDRFCTCRFCGGKLDGRDFLVCDLCEDIYHVSCTEPAVEVIPPRNWYCGSCTARGIGLPHENCVACQKLNTRTQMNGAVDEVFPLHEDTFDSLEDNSSCSMEDELQLSGESADFHLCKVCGTEVENGERSLICGHSFCLNKYYHERCLTEMQVKLYGPCWYCPSCLCRACLTDRDDTKIVLCDGCDHAYHIYCMNPPFTSIPEGKWFCRKCDAGIQEIRKAKRAYENFERKHKKIGEEGKMTSENHEKKQSEKVIGGMDMLLSAAKTLKDEDNLAASHMKS